MVPAFCTDTRVAGGDGETGTGASGACGRPQLLTAEPWRWGCQGGRGPCGPQGSRLEKYLKGMLSALHQDFQVLSLGTETSQWNTWTGSPSLPSSLHVRLIIGRC